MPFVYDTSELELPEDGGDWPSPKPADFTYLSAPDLGGIRGPVQFKVPPLPEVLQPLVPEAAKPALLARLFGVRQVPVQPSYRHQASSWEDRILARFVPALRALGAVQAYGRYDGGNDEGFAWLDHVQLENGARLRLDELATRLIATGLATQMASDYPESAYIQEDPIRALRDDLEYGLSSIWATALLGNGFGTGEYSMYGAFIVDLRTCTILDDPEADPVVRNLDIDLNGTSEKT